MTITWYPDNTQITMRYIGNSTNLDTALSNLDDAISAQQDSGWESWSGSGNYYSIASNQLTLLRGGTGYIKGKKIIWSAPQTTGVIASNTANFIYIDSAGIIGKATTRTKELYQDNIILFSAHNDGTDIEVAVENHSCEFDTGSVYTLHEIIGTVLTPIEGTNIIGADITRVATGTGSATNDRTIKIVGTANLNDEGIKTNIPDSAGAAISWKIYYKNSGGNWTEYATQTQTPMYYNNAGTPTALGTSGSTDVGVYVAYAVKAEPNSGLPIYLLVMNDDLYGTEAAAQTAIANGTIEIADGTLFLALEPVRLGYLIVTNNTSGGYISTVTIAKQVGSASVSGGSGARTASSIPTVSTDFLGGLSPSDSNVQIALNTLDKLERISTALVAAATTDLSTSTGNYVEITGNTGITSFGTHAAGHLLHLKFSGAPLITHSATLDLPGQVNIQIAAGDTMIVRALGTGVSGSPGTSGGYWKCVSFTKYTPTGSFTVEVADAATAGNVASVAQALGKYTKVGDLCYATISILNINTTGLTAGNQVFIRNLPFTAHTLTNGIQPLSDVDQTFVTVTTKLSGRITSATNYISMRDGTGTMIVSQITSGTGDLYFSFAYKTA